MVIKRSGKKNKSVRLWIGLVIIILIVLGAIFYLTVLHNNVSDEETQGQATGNVALEIELEKQEARQPFWKKWFNKKDK